MDIGSAIRYYRKLYNLTQSEVAELSGINEKYLGRIERSESVPSIDKVQQICTAFDIRMSDLLTLHLEKVMSKSKPDNFSDLIFTDGEFCEIYYCNCCGCTFQVNTDEQEEILCPECGCMYDEDNGFIEKNIISVEKRNNEL